MSNHSTLLVIGGGKDGAVAFERTSLSSCNLAQPLLYTCKAADAPLELCSQPDTHRYSLNASITFNSPVTPVPSSLKPANPQSRVPIYSAVSAQSSRNSSLDNPISNSWSSYPSSNLRMPPASEEPQTVIVDNQTPPDKNPKTKYVDNIVETTSLVIQSIWADQYAAKKKKLVSLRVFIQEVLRRSRTTYSTLQTALFYLFRVKNAIVTRLRERPTREHEQQNASGQQCNEDNLIGCGRRMFLAALMVASKYLQDKNYRNRAWAKISGLSVHEINATEIAFLKLIDYNLFVSKPTFDRWYNLLHSQVAGKDDQQSDASDTLYCGTSPVDASGDPSTSLPMTLSSPAARVPSPSELEETTDGSLKQAEDSRVRHCIQVQMRTQTQKQTQTEAQRLLRHAPDSGVDVMYMPTPKLSPESAEQGVSKTFEHRPIARPRNSQVAPVQSSNNVVVAPYIPGVRPVVRTTSTAAYLPSPANAEGGKRKHVDMSMLDEGYSSYSSYESITAAFQVPDVCAVPEGKKFRSTDNCYLGEDAAVVDID